jgi:hypothetical protein
LLLQSYAPEKPIQTSSESSHNPSDVIPDILRLPSLSFKRKELLATVREKAVRTSLTVLFGIDLTRGLEDRAQLESKEMKNITLNNSEVYFKRIMDNELYVHDSKSFSRLQLLEERILERAILDLTMKSSLAYINIRNLTTRLETVCVFTCLAFVSRSEMQFYN